LLIKRKNKGGLREEKYLRKKEKCWSPGYRESKGKRTFLNNQGQ